MLLLGDDGLGRQNVVLRVTRATAIIAKMKNGNLKTHGLG